MGNKRRTQFKEIKKTENKRRTRLKKDSILFGVGKQKWLCLFASILLK